jgi:hypothetical protein
MGYAEGCGVLLRFRAFPSLKPYKCSGNFPLPTRQESGNQQMFKKRE